MFTVTIECEYGNIKGTSCKLIITYRKSKMLHFHDECYHRQCCDAYEKYMSCENGEYIYNRISTIVLDKLSLVLSVLHCLLFNDDFPPSRYL